MCRLFTNLFIIAMMLLLASCGADTAMKKGDKFFALGEYYDAASQYKKAYSQTKAKDKPLRGQRAIKMADCYRRINYTQKAIAAYNNAIRYHQADSMAIFYLGQLQLKNGSYKDAEKTFSSLLDGSLNLGDVKEEKATSKKLSVKKKRSKGDKEKTEVKLKEEEEQDDEAEKKEKELKEEKHETPNIELIRLGLESARLAPKWKANAEYSGYTVKKQELFNSRRSEYSPMLLGDDCDQLYFSSTRNQAKGEEVSGITGTKNADIFFSQKDDKGKWSKPEAIESDLNSEDDEGACGFTPDGKTMYLTVCKTDPNYPRYAQIAKSQRSDASWGKATVVDLTRDTLSTYAHPAVSPDGLWLYFVSDMPGGLGGYDIWRMQITGNGLVGLENLGAPVNTPGNEMFPTFRPNGDLYFSSDGHPGFGGLDIFIAKPQSDELQVKNEKYSYTLEQDSTNRTNYTSNLSLDTYELDHPGWPLNSQGDDFGMTFEGLHNRGYFCSNRGDARGWDHIYSFEKHEVIQTVRGWLYEQDGYELPQGQVYMVGNDGTNLRLSVRGDGSFEQEISPGVSYVFLGTCKGYLNHKEELRVEPVLESEEYTLQFPLANISAPVLINNIFYDFDKATLRPESATALDSLVELLNENPNVTIELSAHTDCRGSAQYNEQLSQRRAESVVNYLIEHGIAPDRLTPKGYGEDKPKTIKRKVAEKYDWLKAGDVLTEEFINTLNDEEKQETCHQLNRRTEFMVLRTTYGMFDAEGKLKDTLPAAKPKQQEEDKSGEELW